MSVHGEKDYYDLLEVSPAATLGEIRTARNIKLKFFHPDRFRNDPELRAEAERKTSELNQAYEVLSDPEKRAAYDRMKGYAPLARDRLAELYYRAYSLLIRHRWDEAIENLQEILAVDADYEQASVWLRIARQELERQRAARAAPSTSQRPSTAGRRCQSCGAYGPTRSVTFEQNIGVLVRRFHKRIQGELCERCISKYFWEFTLITMFFGWWGIISFFATIVFLTSNVANYFPSLSRGAKVVFLAGVLGVPVLLCIWLGGFGTSPFPGSGTQDELVSTSASMLAAPTRFPTTDAGGWKVATSEVAGLLPTKVPTVGTVWADRVIAFNPGPGASAGNSNPSLVLGAPDGVENSSYPGFVQLGRGGSILIAFTDNVIVDGPGSDFRVYGESAEDDFLLIEVSGDGQHWGFFSKVSESPDGLDLAKVRIAQAVYVRLTDVQPGTVTGAQVDAVGALHSGPGIGKSLPLLPDAIAWDDLILREGPSRLMKEVARVSPPAAFELIGRSLDGNWVQVRALNTLTSGWAPAAGLSLNVSVDERPVLQAPLIPSLRPPP